MPPLSELKKNIQRSLVPLFDDPQFQWIADLQEHYPHADIYLVGGAVRDAALGTTDQKDYDFVVRNVPAALLEQFLGAAGTVDFVGKTFGVFKFIPRGVRLTEAFDIALPRTDHAFGTGGYRAVEVQTRDTLPIASDLERRDFTINAMAWHVGGKTLVDPLNGLADLSTKTLRAVGIPTTRFQEDYSRMLRGIRFACQFTFTVEKKTWDAIVALIPHINDATNGARVVPYEIIAKEMLKAFVANPVLAFDLYDASGAFAALVPEMLPMKECMHTPEFHSEGTVWTHTRLSLEKLSSTEFLKAFPRERRTALIVFATMLHDIGKPATIKATNDEHGAQWLSYHGHNKVGAEVASVVCQRLKLSSTPRDGALHVDCDDLYWIIANHLLLLNAKIDEMRASTIERYFFNDRVPGDALLAVILADTLATIPRDKMPNLSQWHAIQERITAIHSVRGERRGRYRDLPAPLLSGDDIIHAFDIEPGKRVGKLLRIVREQQLRGVMNTKEAAILYLREYITAEERRNGKTEN